MSQSTPVTTMLCPDIGNFKEVAVIDLLVKAGDVIEVDTPVLTLETDKATMDVPASEAGTIVEVLFAKGSKISTGTPLLKIGSAAVKAAPADTATPAATASQATNGANSAAAVPATPVMSAAPAVTPTPATKSGCR